MHHSTQELRALAHQWAARAVDRAFDGPSTIGMAPAQVELSSSINAAGLGAEEAWRRWTETIKPSNLDTAGSAGRMEHRPVSGVVASIAA